MRLAGGLWCCIDMWPRGDLPGCIVPLTGGLEDCIDVPLTGGLGGCVVVWLTGGLGGCTDSLLISCLVGLAESLGPTNL